MARAQAGCLLGDVDRETQLHGLAAVLGFVSTTGCAGLTLGGGFGYLTRRFGWTSDNLASIDLVTADGTRAPRVRTARTAICSGGCAAAAATSASSPASSTSFTRSAPTSSAARSPGAAKRRPRVLEMYRSLAAEAPRELTCVAGLRLAPPAPWIAKEVHGKPIVALFVCYSGPLAEAESVIAPIKAFGTPVGDIVQQRTYVSQQMLLDATQPKGRRYYWKSEYLRAHRDGALRAGDRARAAPRLAALRDPDLSDRRRAERGCPEDHSAVGNRDATAVLNIASAWEHAGTTRRTSSGRGTTWRDLRQFSTGGTYVNFLTEDEGDERTLRRVPRELRAAGQAQGGVGSGEPVPHEQEHRSGGRPR